MIIIMAVRGELVELTLAKQLNIQQVLYPLSIKSTIFAATTTILGSGRFGILLGTLTRKRFQLLGFDEYGFVTDMWWNAQRLSVLRT